ncbi:MAG: DUF4203 domain-containing protein [candidate division WOR-3 bacterium]|nr:MAG: DUF4203 domain-containing protein [candidate division WOR-3 bacterium]
MTVAASGVAAVLSILVGGIVCFFGYRVLRAALGIAGFIVGAVLAASGVALIPSSTQVWVLVAALVGGIVGAVLAALLYKVGVFLLGAAAGALVAGLVVTALGLAASWWVLGIGAVAGGILGLVLQKRIVSILTAFVGAWGVVGGTFHLLGWYSIRAGLRDPAALKTTGAYFYLMLVMWLGLGILGMLVQLGTARRRGR